VHLATPRLEVDTGQRRDRAEALADAAKGER
jgi:hypothetical protein